MSDARHQRWLEIIDRETLGEPISAEDQEFRATHEAVNPECARESRAWSEMLAQLSDVGDDDDGDDPEAIVAAALHGGRGPVAPAGRGRVVWLAGLGLAAAAALALAVLPGEDEASPEVAEAPRASP